MDIPIPVIHQMLHAVGLSIDLRKAADSLTEMAIAIVSDALFGPVLGVRSSDGEIRIRLVPVTNQDTERLVPSHIVEPEDREVFLGVLMRLSRLAEECPEMTALELANVSIHAGQISVGELSMRGKVLSSR